ncbi:hypothetical protein BBJ29_009528 [Phytophthora kernoviae]|uniref:RxLR effector protein n=1 Tax=Phytophthora kernoviae TaxID=325452 RepID=A0A3F2RCS3_9STRA|nr:hypothetical protein BBJ29_009528 [Phytophthora kernoviae]RLN53199.1 hypothetical protein BBP00_00009383 [Phytophthora kernoviae]
MRPSFILLLVLALLVAFCNAASATTRTTAVSIADRNKRSLRAVQKEDDDDDKDEEERLFGLYKLSAKLKLIKLGYRTVKDFQTMEKLKAAAAGNGAKAVKAAEKLKAMELKAAAAGNGVMSANAVAKEEKMFKGLLDAKVAPSTVYRVLGLDRLDQANMKHTLLSSCSSCPHQTNEWS